MGVSEPQEPPHTPETPLMAREGTYFITLDKWANLSWFARERGVQMALRELYEEVRTLGYRQTRRNRVSPTR